MIQSGGSDPVAPLAPAGRRPAARRPARPAPRPDASDARVHLLTSARQGSPSIWRRFRRHRQPLPLLGGIWALLLSHSVGSPAVARPHAALAPAPGVAH